MLQCLKRVGILGLGLAMTMGLVLPGMTQAAMSTTVLAAMRVTTSGNGTLTMAPGETKDVTVIWQNAGTQTWSNTGDGYISLYTHGPKYRVSQFASASWLSPSQVQKMKEATVKAKGTATVSFQLKAPVTEGKYSETFALASESMAWIIGGDFTLSINVAKPVTVVTNTPASTTTAVTPSDSGLKAALAMQTANKLKARAGKTFLLSAGFMNTGSKTWTSYGLQMPDVSVASASNVSFTNSTWVGTKLAYVSGAAVKPGETAYVSFAITAPGVNGTHAAKFQFTANDVTVRDAVLEIPVTVTDGRDEVITTAPSNSPIAGGELSVNQDDVIIGNEITEPMVRVGVLIVDEETDDQVVVTSNESDFTVTDTNGNLLAEMTKGQKVTAAWDGTRYTFNRGNGLEKSTYPLRFVPKIANSVMLVVNFDRTVTRGSSNADNTFRNVLELRHNDVKSRSWLINELPMEFYLKGLAETSNVSHIEFQKALITAARTYAFYHWTRNTKHDGEGFHVDAYADQVYKGYGQEVRTPRLSQAIDATRGEIVTYNGETAITAYFSRSAGKTLDWSEVWGGNVPWSKSVPVPCDVGKTLWGHGIGMSASGALCMANDGKMWQEILKYFYTGIALDKRW
ncbi:TPA: hypothetical protein DEP96_03965 [Candidatus Uhrbacteria bacterium]|nr:hypothetical protein [Candidatus Uhrbacteria bacterium]